MICEITGSRYSHKKHKIIHETFTVEFNMYYTNNKRYEGAKSCFFRGYNECINRGLDFIKLEIIAE